MKHIKQFVLILSLSTHFATTTVWELVSSRTTWTCFLSFFLLKGEVNEVRPVTESPVGTRMTHITWMGTIRAELEPWPWGHLKPVKLNFLAPPVARQALSEEDQASLPRFPSAGPPSCLMASPVWSQSGSYFFRSVLAFISLGPLLHSISRPAFPKGQQ